MKKVITEATAIDFQGNRRRQDQVDLKARPEFALTRWRRYQTMD